MRFRYLTGATALVAALMMTIGGAAAFDDSKYPNLKGQWRRVGAVPNTSRFGLAFDPSKPFREEQPPLTPEYEAIYEANIDDMEKGGQGIDPTYNCLSPGMPRVMADYSRMEFVVTPETTYIPMTRDHDFIRHIYTDGRAFPANMAVELAISGGPFNSEVQHMDF